MPRSLLIWCAALLCCCTSLSYQYTPNTPRSSLAQTKVKVALTKFIDLREPLRPDLTRQETDYFVERTEKQRGITHENKPLVPPSVVLRDLFEEELIYAGITVIPINEFDDKRTTPKELGASAKAVGADYVVSAKIKSFSIVQAKPSKYFSPVLVVYPFAGALLKKAPPVTYSVRIDVSLIRASDGNVLWTSKIQKEKVDRRRGLVTMQNKMFKEILSPLIVGAIHDLLINAEKDYEKQKPKK